MLILKKYEKKYEADAEKFINKVFGPNYTILRYIPVSRDQSLIIFFQNRIIGTIIMAPDPVVANVDFVCFLCIDEEWRRRGLASKLLKFAAKLSGRDLALYVNVNNSKAIKLYEKRGFIKAFIVPRYYGSDDAFLMFRKKIT